MEIPRLRPPSRAVKRDAARGGAREAFTGRPGFDIAEGLPLRHPRPKEVPIASPAPRVVVVVPAAGRGERAGLDQNKTLAPLGGLPVIVRTVAAFQEHPRISGIRVVAARGDWSALEALFAERQSWSRLGPWVEGGATRQDSVARALAALDEDPPDWVLIHDAARPFCSAALVDRVLAALVSHGAVVPLLPLHETIRRVEGTASRVEERSLLFRTQTPQGFHWPLFREAHRRAGQEGRVGTDDAQLVEETGGALGFVEGEPRNIKLTTPADFRLGEWLVANPDWGC